MYLSKIQALSLAPLLLALVCGALVTVAAPTSAQEVTLEVGETIPEFDVWDEKNFPISSKRWVDGTPFLVDFWATWCGPCRFTLPEIEQIHRDYGDRLNVYGVSVDSGAGGGFRARNFAQEGGVTYPILPDLKAEARKATGVNVLPVLLLYDGDGNLVKDWWGEPDFDEVREAIDGVVEPAAEAVESEEADEADSADD